MILRRGIYSQRQEANIIPGSTIYFNPNELPPIGATLSDLSGNGNNGTLQGGVSYNSITNALDFDGVNGLVNTSFTYYMDGNKDFTVFCTMQTTTADLGVICAIYGGVPVPFWIGMRDTGKGFSWTRDNARNSVTQLTTSDLDDNNKHVLCYRKSGNNFSFFVDGVLEASASLSTGVISTSATLKLGAREPGVQHFTGSIYNMALYDYGLTQLEVEETTIFLENN